MQCKNYTLALIAQKVLLSAKGPMIDNDGTIITPASILRPAQDREAHRAARKKEDGQRQAFKRRMKRIELRAVAAVKRIKAGSGSK